MVSWVAKLIQHINASNAFVSAKELMNVLDERALVVIDISGEYKKSHIVGAQSLDVSILLDERNRLIPQEELQEIFRELGLSSSSNLVIYGRSSMQDLKDAAFLAYVLISNDFENVSILDGGYMAWVFEYDFFTTIDENELEEGTLTLNKVNHSVDFNDLNRSKNKLIIDARYPQKYYGISEDEGDKYIGHMPGAKNSYYAYKFLKDYTLRPKKDLDMIYKDGLGIDQVEEIIIYGDDQKEAALEWYIVYKYLGYKNAKIYYNSFKEYVDWGFKTERFKWE